MEECGYWPDTVMAARRVGLVVECVVHIDDEEMD